MGGGQEQKFRKKRLLQNVDNMTFSGDYVITAGKAFIFFPFLVHKQKSCTLIRKQSDASISLTKRSFKDSRKMLEKSSLAFEKLRTFQNALHVFCNVLF